MSRRKAIWLGVGGVLLLLLLVGPRLISIDSYRQRIEAEGSKALGRPLKVAALHLRLLPRPAAVVSGVTVNGYGDEGTLQVSSIAVVPQVGPLLRGRVEVHTLKVTGMRAPLALLQALATAPRPAAAGAAGPEVAIDEIDLRDVTLLRGKQALGPYRGEVLLGPGMQPQRVKLRDAAGHFEATLGPAEGHRAVALKAHDWTVPVGPPLHFTKLTAAGRLFADHLNLDSVQGRAYGGDLDGKGELAWGKRWQAKGSFKAAGVQLEPLLAALGKRVISGRLQGSGGARASAAKPAGLADALDLNAVFEVKDGVLLKADLEKASSHLSKKGLTGGRTPFETLSGKAHVVGREIRLRDLKLVSSVLEASGHVVVNPKRQLDGELDVDVRRTGALLSMPLKVGGTVDDPSVRPTDDALIGAAVGTGVLGPGVGTAVGAKAGRLIKKLGDVFGGEEKK